ncbi:MAG: hypothetical protein ACKOTZ_04120, partial [Chloroflexota bacterium]
ALIAGTAGLVGADEGQRFTFFQEVPEIGFIDNGPAGRSYGDMMSFSAAVRTDDGLTGTIHGMVFTIEVRGDGPADETRVGQIVFDLGDGDSIVVAGASVYGADLVEMPAGLPQFRAVIGGTGTYIGARGEVVTIRQEEGTYTHAVTLLP